MADHANSINTSTPWPSRRTLFAGAAAVILGGRISSGAAASVADLVLVDTDAALIAACEHFNAIELECRASLEAARTHDDEERADALSNQLHGGSHQRDWPALNRICATPGSSYAAAVALATSIAIYDTGTTTAPEDDPEGYVTERLLGALIRCLLRSA